MSMVFVPGYADVISECWGMQMLLVPGYITMLSL